MTRKNLLLIAGAFSLLTLRCSHLGPADSQPDARSRLVGAWRSTVQFKSGAFATIKDLEFMYVFNVGGTMTESSNYDESAPVPPAYGIWRASGSNEFQAKFEFYMTKPPAGIEDITTGGGWPPAGRGVLAERIVLSEHGNSFTSTILYEAVDFQGKPVEGGGEAVGKGLRLRF